ncbi:hypothetical protein JW964_26745 [candidate division KSB1 bacterium]|nr:hypothetical protein [candidate division KSB1 bacterium]
MESKERHHPGVDKSLIAMFLKLTPEERLEMNDRMATTILELRNAYQQRKFKKNSTKLDA